MYLAVRGDNSGGILTGEEISVIAEKFFASLFGQPSVLAKIISSKIPDQDPARSFVVFLPTQRPRQVEVWNDCRHQTGTRPRIVFGAPSEF
jgi:hypothetical protein